MTNIINKEELIEELKLLSGYIDSRNLVVAEGVLLLQSKIDELNAITAVQMVERLNKKSK